MTSDHSPFSLRARRQDGFTLIELLVVIVILGVLAAIVVFSVRGIGDKGHKSATAADAAALRTAEESFCARHGHYGTVDDLKADGLLSSEPGYNVLVVGEENKCGRGEKSSYTVHDTSPTETGAEAIPVGLAPADVAVDEKADRVYVAASGSDAVTVIDGKTDEPIGPPIDVSGAVSAPNRIAVDPGTGRVYVGGTAAAGSGGSVAIIDTAHANRVTQVSDYTTTVTGLAVSPENGDVYVGGGNASASAVAYIAAGSSSATPIRLPDTGLVGPSNGMDFSFDPAHHAVYFVKAGVGNSTGGLFAVSSQTHTAEVVVDFPTKPGCGSATEDGLAGGSARGSTAVDPRRNLVYLIAKRCVMDPASGTRKSVAATIVIDPVGRTSTAIDDPVGSLYPFNPITVVYNSAAGAVYVYLDGGTSCGKSGGRIDRIVGTTVTGQATVCGASKATGNPAHKLTVLKNFNRVFAAQQNANGTPGGIGVVDGSTLLPQAPLGTPRQFAALAVNNTTGKVYAVDPAGTVAVFRTGSA
ncbi:prepilin-type N-terminal cleavage/methylation domain-containing protein [Streptomyces seoulensis]